ncbi:MAG: hydrogenase subunit MbhD domain-containing protein [Sulfolobales archaeon]
MEVVPISIAAVAALLSVIATYLAVRSRDMLTAVVFSAVQSTAYALIYYVLMAPDIVLVYIPVSVGILPAVTVLLIKKTERYES